MYTPASFASDDTDAIDRVLDRHPFALLVSTRPGAAPAATHLPLVARRERGALVLEGHLARANPHGEALREAREVMAVFGGPHGYVSPSLYDTPLAVPTWNYIAVHVHGTVEMVDDADAKDAVLKRLIGRHEPAYATQWRGLPEAYTRRMLDAIVALRVDVTHVEAKFKLSQNRSAAERERVARSFAEGSAEERSMAEWMVALGVAPPAESV